MTELARGNFKKSSISEYVDDPLNFSLTPNIFQIPNVLNDIH